jgi:ankyrin repeat protein
MATLLCIAVKWGHTSHTEIIDLFLTKGADIESECLGRSALQRASERGNREVVELLLLRGADIGVRCEGRTALQMASEKGHTKVVELLLSIGSTYDDSDLPNTSTNDNATKQQEPNLEEIDGAEAMEACPNPSTDQL